MIKSVISRNRQNNSVNLSGSALTHPASSLFLSVHQIHDLPERRKEGHDLGAWLVRQRNRKISRSASTVSPRTVKSVTTHNYQCHHAQLPVSPCTTNRTNSQNPSGPVLLHPAIHLHPPFISIRHTVYRTEGTR